MSMLKNFKSIDFQANFSYAMSKNEGIQLFVKMYLKCSIYGPDKFNFRGGYFLIFPIHFVIDSKDT
jgi:hypothetical protein